jgi:hypothetical protein
MSQRPERTPVAADIYTYCTREKTETWHVVRNHNAMGVVDRVICKSCGSDHKYKMPESAKPANLARAGSTVIRRSSSGSSATGSTAKPAGGVLSDTWFNKVKAWGEKPLKKYSPDESYAAGEMVEHIAFGKGAVERVRENKAEILFRDGLKTLPCKKKALITSFG